MNAQTVDSGTPRLVNVTAQKVLKANFALVSNYTFQFV